MHRITYGTTIHTDSVDHDINTCGTLAHSWNKAWNGTAPDPIGMDAQTFVNEYRLEVAGEFSFRYILRRMGEDNNFVRNTH